MTGKMSLQKVDKLFLRGYLSIGVAARLPDLTKAAAFVILNGKYTELRLPPGKR